MKRTNTIKTYIALVIVLFLVIASICPLGSVLAVDSVAASSLLATWQMEQKSTTLDGEKIRSTVDTYFDMGYADRMSSSFVSRTALLGTTASETASAQSWAQYADALLKYNILCWQAQGYVPTSYAYVPSYGDAVVAKDGLTATVAVEPICDLYFASRSTPDRVGSEKHVLTLQKQNGIWQIVSDKSDMDSVSYPLGTDFDELTKTFPARFAAWKNDQAQLAEQAHAEAAAMKQNGDSRLHLLDPQKGGDAVSGTALVIPAVSNYVSYDRSRAAQYTYWTNGTSDISPYPQGWGYNSLFPVCSNDCMNFASQVVWFGFGGSNDSTHINSHAFPMITSGSYPWMPGTPEWQTIMSTDHSFLEMIDANRTNDLIGVQGFSNQTIGGIESGDLIEEITPDTHIMAVSSTADKHGTPYTTEYDEIYVSAHNGDVFQRSLINYIADSTRVHFVWICSLRSS